MEISFSQKYESLFEILNCWNTINSPTFKTDYSEKEQEYQIALSKVDTVMISGGRDCFKPTQEVITLNGVKQIKDIVKDDIVLTYNEKENKKEFNKVFKTKKVTKKQTIKIQLKNGTEIECTPDHEFYFEGRWVKIKDLLSLWYGDMEKNKEVR